MDDLAFKKVEEYLRKIPGIDGSIHNGSDDGLWWLKFQIDISHPIAWNVVQELAYIFNGLSLANPLPTLFMPVSPPTGNGGPSEYLSWVIESKDKTFTPDICARYLESYLPNPIDDPIEWVENEE